VTVPALVLVETAGNQDYIFDTNRLREQVGASELIWRLGTKVVLEAVREVGGPNLTGSLQSAEQRAAALSDPARNPPLEAQRLAVEVVLAASGTAMLLVDQEETGRRIVERVTRWARVRAPGLDAWGVVVAFDAAGDQLHEVVGRAHRALAEVRARLPGPAGRFARLPIVAECASSGLPAERLAHLVPEEPVPLSAVVLAKLAAADDGYRRIRTLISGGGIELPGSLADLERRLGAGGWFGLVHADGNGIGGVLRRLHEHLDLDAHAAGLARNRAYLERLRRFSTELDRCTEGAFLEAVDWLAAASRDSQPSPGDRGERPDGADHQQGRKRRDEEQRSALIVPLVLGGDDVTAVCDGRHALGFARRFLEAFEHRTAAAATVAAVARWALGTGRLSAAAGVALIKPHFPFHAGYDLAADLTRQAKRATQPATAGAGAAPLPLSALDFHVLYDTSGAELGHIRATRTADDGATCLWGGPYVVTPPGELPAGLGEQARAWLAAREVARLDVRVAAIRERDPDSGRRRLPASMLHELRAGLFDGHASADGRLRLLWPRYQRTALWQLLEAGGGGKDPSLFRQEGDRRVTGVLDALDVADLWLPASGEAKLPAAAATAGEPGTETTGAPA
jgi:hypothetical protein